MRVHWALLGGSGIAPSHAGAIQRCRRAQLDVVWSRDAARAQTLGKRHGTRWTTSLDEILGDRKIDAVDVVTDPARHLELARPVLEQGKHLLIEKPLDASLEAAEAFVAVAECAPVHSSVVSNFRFDPIVRSMRHDAVSGALGQVLSAEVSIPLCRGLVYYRHGTGWRAREGQVLRNQAMHWIDVLLWCFGAPREINAVLERTRPEVAVYDRATVDVTHANGVRSRLYASTAETTQRPEGFRIKGTRGLRDYGALAGSAPWRARRLGTSAHMKLRAAVRGVSRYGQQTLDAQVADLVGCILGGGDPCVSIRDGVKAMQFVRQCEEAASASAAAVG